MKRIRWNEKHECYEWDDGDGTVARGDPGNMFTGKYRGHEWAEVNNAIYDCVSGEIILEVKESPKVPTLLEAAQKMSELFGKISPAETGFSYHEGGKFDKCIKAWSELKLAIAREVANPPKTSDSGRIPQRLLDAIDPGAVPTGGTRAILICSDGSWGVRDFTLSQEEEPVDLWADPFAVTDNSEYIKPLQKSTN